MKCSSNRLLVVRVVEDSRVFEALEEEWEDLYQNSPLATPFQSWAWLYSWWESYGEDHRLQLITLRDRRGLLVGLIPLMLVRRRGFGSLLFVGTGVSDYLDVLARRGWEEVASEAAMETLHDIGHWHVADLHQLRPDAAAWNIVARWPGPQTRIWQSSCSIVDAKPWDELVASLSRKTRSDVRRTLQRAEADGLRCELVDPDNAEQAGRRLVALHREAWQGRNITLEHLTRRYESHIVTAATRMAASGLGGISQFHQDGEVIASNFLLFGHDFIGGYLTGASKRALQRYQLSSLSVWDAMNIARDRHSDYLDMLRGDEPYKLRWNPTVVSSHRAILGRSFISWKPYVSYHSLRCQIRRYLLDRRKGTPKWVKLLPAKYRSLAIQSRKGTVAHRAGSNRLQWLK